MNEPEYTQEEDEAWKELESRLNELQQMTKKALQTYLERIKNDQSKHLPPP